jgi:hypothetical protein
MLIALVCCVILGAHAESTHDLIYNVFVFQVEGGGVPSTDVFYYKSDPRPSAPSLFKYVTVNDYTSKPIFPSRGEGLGQVNINLRREKIDVWPNYQTMRFGRIVWFSLAGTYARYHARCGRAPEVLPSKLDADASRSVPLNAERLLVSPEGDPCPLTAARFRESGLRLEPKFLSRVPQSPGKEGNNHASEESKRSRVGVGEIDSGQDVGRSDIPIFAVGFPLLYGLSAYLGKRWAEYRYAQIIGCHSDQNGRACR